MSNVVIDATQPFEQELKEMQREMRVSTMKLPKVQLRKRMLSLHGHTSESEEVVSVQETSNGFEMFNIMTL